MMKISTTKEIYHKLVPERLRRLAWRLRKGEPVFPLSSRARHQFQYLARYYPPHYYPGYLQKIVGFYLILHTVNRHKLDGDIVECGVGMGLSFFVLGSFADQLKLGRRLYGFDSFQGFPQPSKYDESARNPSKGDLWSETSVDHVKQHFIDAGLGDFLKECVVVPGFFDTTLHRVTDLDTISFLNLDVDLYDSYRICMRVLGPRVTGLILYDEYDSPKWPGATRAIDESLPGLGHTLFRSRLIQRYFSLPRVHLSSEFGCDILDVLHAEAVGAA